MPKRMKITAREWADRLNADPEFVAAAAAREAVRQQREAAFRRAERPLLEDVRAAGYTIDDVWDLVNTAAWYADLVPVLIRHLGEPYPDAIRDGIARALAIPQAKAVFEELVQFYRAEPDGTRTKQGLAAAIARAADHDRIPDVIHLVRDRNLGPTRGLLLRALTRSRNPEAKKTLTDMADDPDLYKEIDVILRRATRRQQRVPAEG